MKTKRSTSPLKFKAVIDVWRVGVDREADEDPADQQEQLESMMCDSQTQAESLGRLLATHARNTTPGEFRVMAGTPNKYSMDGYDWVPFEPSRPRP